MRGEERNTAHCGWHTHYWPYWWQRYGAGPLRKLKDGGQHGERSWVALGGLGQGVGTNADLRSAGCQVQLWEFGSRPGCTTNPHYPAQYCGETTGFLFNWTLKNQKSSYRDCRNCCPDHQGRRRAALLLPTAPGSLRCSSQNGNGFLLISERL